MPFIHLLHLLIQQHLHFIMASKLELGDVVVKHNTVEDDSYAVQPVNSNSSVPVDGPVPDATDSLTKPAPDPDALSDSDQLALDSPFHSPRSAPEDGMRDTTLEDGDVPEDMLHDCPTATIGGKEDCSGVVVAKLGGKESEDKNGMSWRFEEVDDADCGVEEEDRCVDTAMISTVDAAEHEEADVKPEVTEDSPNNAHNSANVEAVTECDASDNAPRDTQEVTEPTSQTANVDEDIAVADVEESDTRTAAPSQSARNVPPHLRADFQSPATQQASVRVRQ
jgi:hypothetical protein